MAAIELRQSKAGWQRVGHLKLIRAEPEQPVNITYVTLGQGRCHADIDSPENEREHGHAEVMGERETGVEPLLSPSRRRSSAEKESSFEKGRSEKGQQWVSVYKPECDIILQEECVHKQSAVVEVWPLNLKHNSGNYVTSNIEKGYGCFWSYSKFSFTNFVHIILKSFEFTNIVVMVKNTFKSNFRGK